MARKPRAFHEGIYHLGSHGSDVRNLFLTDEDRIDFLGRLAATCRRFDLPLLSYVLMGNHYHVLVSTEDARISDALQRLHTGYSRSHNRRHDRNAHLFLAHPFAREVDGSDDLLGTLRYLALNPVEAGFVRIPSTGSGAAPARTPASGRRTSRWTRRTPTAPSTTPSSGGRATPR